ncbi:MAG: hypothetical protein UIM53_03930 [Acutalibacteraceae bacterium]|nr:hypothetical protein [Acutalibacteraceae bacterium]
MLGSCRLNNKSMRNVRRTDAYQAVAIDLALLGVITKEECEMLLDGGIPSGISLPDGSSRLASEKALSPKPDFIQIEPDEPEPTDVEPTDVEPTDVEPTDVEHTDVEPVDTVTVEPGETEPDEAQEPVDDEGRTESDN